MSPEFKFEGDVEISFSGYEGYTTVYIEPEEGDAEDLADVIADRFCGPFKEPNFYEARGKLRITVELVEEFKKPPPRNPDRWSLFPKEPTCNCVHTFAPDEHLPYCATWGGKRLPSMEKSNAG